MTGATYLKRNEPEPAGRVRTADQVQVSPSSYLKRHKQRLKDGELKENILFGLSLGWVLTLVGGFRYLFLIDGDAWLYSCYAGLGLLGVAVVVPDLAGYPRRLLRLLARGVANQLFKLILALLYFLVVMPVGLISHAVNGRVCHPFYSWTESPPLIIEGWVDKTSSDEERLVGAEKGPTSVFLQPMQVLGYFATSGQMLLMPCLLIFLLLGVIGIFLQSSALAPFIYTLF